MDISTNDDLNVLYDLLEVLTNLGVTFKIDKIYHNKEKSTVRVCYIHGEMLYRVEQ